MSLQLVYTSAERLLDPGMSGYGVVARSEKMPVPLAKKIAKLSNFKDFQQIKGPQYSYHIIDCAGHTYHILSCVQEAGSDYTGRDCHIAHHLALPQELARNLRKNSNRPTPAGIMLTLAENGFWLKSWKGAPSKELIPAPLTLDKLPSVEKQETWQRLTSHKSNAWAFSTPPYEHDCLITIPNHISSLEILQLISESDWLDHYRGWGKTFTTHGESKDTFADTQRIFVADGDTMEERAKRTGRPILRIHPAFQLPIPEQQGLVPIVQEHTPSEADAEREQQLFAKPIIINESPGYSPIPSPATRDGDDSPNTAESKEHPLGRKAQRKRKNRMWILPTAALISLLVTAALLLQNKQTPPEHGSTAMRDGRPNPSHREHGPYTHQQNTPNSSRPHPFDQKQVTQNQNPRANNNQPSAPFHNPTSSKNKPSPGGESALAKQTKPQASHPSKPQPAQHQQNDKASVENLHIQNATLSGDIMPMALQNILRNVPAIIDNGSIRVGCLSGNTSASPLRKGQQHLVIDKIAEGEYKLTIVSNNTKKDGDTYILRADSHFHSFTINGEEAYLLLEIQRNKLNHLFLLMPRYKQTIKLYQSGAIPEIKIEITPADVTFAKGTQFTQTPKMTLSGTYLEQCPKTQGVISNYQDGTNSLTLPKIKRFGANYCVQSDEDNASNQLYRWECEETQSSNPSVNNYQYQIARCESLCQLIQARFSRLCNSPCAGRGTSHDPFFSIATLYYILEEFDRDSSPTASQALTARYCKLFALDEFAEILSPIINPESGLTLSPSESDLQSEECIQKRRAIGSKLEDKSTRQQLKERICHFLSTELQSIIKSGIEEDLKKEHLIELNNAHSIDGKAIWTFQIK